jgi:hypothetical protein
MPNYLLYRNDDVSAGAKQQEGTSTSNNIYNNHCSTPPNTPKKVKAIQEGQLFNHVKQLEADGKLKFGPQGSEEDDRIVTHLVRNCF